MDYFRLTWAVGNEEKRDIFDCEHRYEVLGSREAIFDLWFHLSQLEELAKQRLHASACPRFLTIVDKNGIPQEPRHGLQALVNEGTYQ
ncbi:MAG: hypothetical protein NPIRA02_02140 [Nitrospirales bacterium]|nr:MAG: hypothetical protein NPIRA02_02140 [Nitrospirales bacterium]